MEFQEKKNHTINIATKFLSIGYVVTVVVLALFPLSYVFIFKFYSALFPYNIREVYSWGEQWHYLAMFFGIPVLVAWGLLTILLFPFYMQSTSSKLRSLFIITFWTSLPIVAWVVLGAIFAENINILNIL